MLLLYLRGSAIVTLCLTNTWSMPEIKAFTYEVLFLQTWKPVELHNVIGWSLLFLITNGSTEWIINCNEELMFLYQKILISYI